MDLIGKYLRLRRELLEPLPRSPELAMRRQRVTQDMVSAVADLEDGQPERVPFLETMPWSDTISMSYDEQPGRLTL